MVEMDGNGIGWKCGGKGNCVQFILNNLTCYIYGRLNLGSTHLIYCISRMLAEVHLIRELNQMNFI